MEKRRKAKNNKNEYDKLNNEIINKCNIAKEEWLNKQCRKLEKEQYKDTKSMHRRVGCCQEKGMLLYWLCENKEW